jgi:hypothetical protein
MLLRSHKCEYGLLEVKPTLDAAFVELALIVVKVTRGMIPD